MTFFKTFNSFTEFHNFSRPGKWDFKIDRGNPGYTKILANKMTLSL